MRRIHSGAATRPLRTGARIPTRSAIGPCARAPDASNTADASNSANGTSNTANRAADASDCTAQVTDRAANPSDRATNTTYCTADPAHGTAHGSSTLGL